MRFKWSVRKGGGDLRMYVIDAVNIRHRHAEIKPQILVIFALLAPSPFFFTYQHDRGEPPWTNT